jgi:hypothetical protein
MATAEVCPACGIDTPVDDRAKRLIWRHTVTTIFLVTAAFVIAYRGVEEAGLMQTYAAFVGIPLLIGVLTTYLSYPKTRTGVTLLGTTIVLCFVAMLLGEGAICILMAAPIFYVVALMGCAIVTFIEDYLNGKGRGGPAVIVLLPFLLAKLTSSPQGIANPSTMTVQDDIFIAAPPSVVWDRLLHGELVSQQFSPFLRLGFPLPTKLERDGKGEARLTFDPGSEPWPGTNVIISREKRDPAARHLSFVILKDGTKLSRWLTFRDTHFAIEAAPGGSRLRQTTTFQQRLQPGLYWNPLQSYAMTQMHVYALEHIKSLAETAQHSTAAKSKASQS